MDAILISANPTMVTIDDAIRHLVDHDELYWRLGSRLPKTNSLTQSTALSTSVADKLNTEQPSLTSFRFRLLIMRTKH